ncbi:hypothetical protein EK21DRAFT_107456 [Setomelanomma holmii]|uniref:Uncharacterized protein n=1 Tax=Setomelanomma holmii TaxID=210430 RepID=A0A9P4HIV1_9PLEO|nr:hypothetical protein EK21DRAFT_107456 [Setomelanomma holmii]
MHFSTTSFAALAALASTTICTPITLPTIPTPQLLRRAPYQGCTAEQTKHIDNSLLQVSGMAVSGDGVLNQDKSKWSTNKGYTHYFKDEDYDMVKKAYDVLMTIGESTSKVKFNVKCGKEAANDCPVGGFAYADPTPESFEGHGHSKGLRYLTICPQFFTSKRTTGALPTSDDKEGLKKFCDGKETKKVMDYEVGGHTLMHEISHLDSFGLAAGYPEETDNSEGYEFKYHGTVDWKGSSTAGNARVLKNSKAKNRPKTWQNAESLAAAATEMGAMWRCDVTDISD